MVREVYLCPCTPIKAINTACHSPPLQMYYAYLFAAELRFQSTLCFGQPANLAMLLITGQRRWSMTSSATGSGEFVMTKQPEERDVNDKSTSGGQQQHGGH